MNDLTNMCAEVLQFLSKTQRNILNTILAWATLWPFLYLVAPMILGKDISDTLLDWKYLSTVFYLLIILVVLRAGILLKTPLLFIFNSFIAYAAFFGHVDKELGPNVCIHIPPKHVRESFGNSFIHILKYWLIGAIALLTLNLGLEDRIEERKIKHQKNAIETLTKRVNKLENAMKKVGATNID